MKENKNEILTVPYVVYDSEMKRKQTLIVLLILGWFLTFAGIIIYSAIPTEDYAQEVSDIEYIQDTEINNGGN